MKIIKNISCLVLAIVVTTTAFGQGHKGHKKEHKEKIKTMKIGYITEKLNLTSAEAQQFWPIYNEYNTKMDNIRKTTRKMHKTDTSIDEMTDAEVEKMVNTHTEMRQNELNIKKEYHKKFKAILPIKKVAKLYKAEHGFKRELLKKLKVHKGGHNELNIPPPPPKGER